MSAQRTKKRLGSRRSAPNQNKTPLVNETDEIDGTDLIQQALPEEKNEPPNTLSDPESSHSETVELKVNRRKLGSRRKNKVNPNVMESVTELCPKPKEEAEENTQVKQTLEVQAEFSQRDIQGSTANSPENVQKRSDTKNQQSHQDETDFDGEKTEVPDDARLVGSSESLRVNLVTENKKKESGEDADLLVHGGNIKSEKSDVDSSLGDVSTKAEITADVNNPTQSNELQHGADAGRDSSSVDETSADVMHREQISPLASQHPDTSVCTEEQTDSRFNPTVNRRKLGSSRRNKRRQPVEDSAAEPHETKQEDVEIFSGCEASEATKMSSLETVVQVGKEENDACQTESVSSPFEEESLEKTKCTQWVGVKTNNVVEPAMKLATTTENSLHGHMTTQPEHSDAQAAYSTPTDEMSANHENGQFSVSEPTQIQQINLIDYFNENVLHNSKEISEICVQTEISDTSQPKSSVKSDACGSTQREVSHSDEKQEEYSAQENHVEVLHQKNQDCHLYDPRKPQTTDLETVNTAVGQVYEDDLHPSVQSHHLEEGTNSLLFERTENTTLQTETASESQSWDIYEKPLNQDNNDLSTTGKSGKSESVHGVEDQQNVKEPDTKSEMMETAGQETSMQTLPEGSNAEVDSVTQGNNMEALDQIDVHDPDKTQSVDVECVDTAISKVDQSEEDLNPPIEKPSRQDEEDKEMMESQSLQTLQSDRCSPLRLEMHDNCGTILDQDNNDIITVDTSGQLESVEGNEGEQEVKACDATSEMLSMMKTASLQSQGSSLFIDDKTHTGFKGSGEQGSNQRHKEQGASASVTEPFSEHKEAAVEISQEPIVEQSDQFVPSGTKVSTPELTSPGEYYYSLVDQQAIEQSNSEQVPEELPSVSSVADGEPKEREEEESFIALKMITAKSNNQEPTEPGGRVGVENSTNIPFIKSTVKGDHDSEDAARKDLKGEVKTTYLPSLDSSQLINHESHTAFKPPGSRRKMGSSRRHKEKRGPDSVAEPSSELKGEAAEVEGAIVQESIFPTIGGMMTNEEQNEELVVSVIGESSYSVEEVHEEAIGPSDMQQINLIDYSNQRALPDITEDLNIISEPFSEHKEATVVTSEEPIVEQSDQFDPSDTKVSTPELTSPGEYSYSLVDQQAMEQSNSEQVPEELLSVSSVADGEPKEREEEESYIALKMVTAKSNNQEPTKPGGRVGVENSTNVPFIVSTVRGDHDSEDAARKDLKGEVKTTPLPSLDSSQLINEESHTAFKPPGSRRKMGSSRRHKEKQAPDSVAEPSSELKEEIADVEGTIVQERIFSPIDGMMTNEEQNEELVVSVIGESSYSGEEVHEEEIRLSDMQQINLIDYSNESALPDITEDLAIISGTTEYQNEVAESHHSEFSGESITDGSTGQNGSNPLDQDNNDLSTTGKSGKSESVHGVEDQQNVKEPDTKSEMMETVGQETSMQTLPEGSNAEVDSVTQGNNMEALDQIDRDSYVHDPDKTQSVDVECVDTALGKVDQSEEDLNPPIQKSSRQDEEDKEMMESQSLQTLQSDRCSPLRLEMHDNCGTILDQDNNDFITVDTSGQLESVEGNEGEQDVKGCEAKSEMLAMINTVSLQSQESSLFIDDKTHTGFKESGEQGSNQRHKEQGASASVTEPFSEHKETAVEISQEPIVEQSDQFDPSDTKVSTPELTSPGEYYYSLVDQQAIEQSNSEQVPEELPSVSSVADGEPKEREEEESFIALKMVTAKINNQEPTEPGGRVGVENSTNVPFIESTDRGDHDSEDAARKDLKGEVKTTPLPSLDSSQLINDESHTAFKPPGSRRKMGSSRRHKEKRAPDSVAEPSSELKEEAAEVEGTIVQESIFSPVDRMMTNEEQNEELVVSVIGESSYSVEEVHEEAIGPSDMQQINLIDYSNQRALPDITEDLNIISEPFSEHKEATVVTSEEPIVEQSDQFDPSDTKVSTPELTSPGEYYYSLVDQQAIEQSNSEQVPEELPSVSSAADGEPKEREEEESYIALKMITAKSNNQEPTKPGGRVGVENSTNIPFIESTVKGDHDSEDAARKDLKGEVKTTSLPSLDSSQLINDESHTAFKPPGSRRKMGSSRRHKEKQSPDSVAEPSSELKEEIADVEGAIVQEHIFSPIDGMMTNEEQNEELVVSVIGESSYSGEEVHEEEIRISDMQQINLIDYSNQRALPDITEDVNIISEPFSEHKEATVVTSEEPIVEQSDQFDPSDTKVSTPELTSPGEYSYSLVDQQAMEQSNSEQVPEELLSVSSVADGEPKEREEEESFIALKMVTAKSNNQEPTEPGGRVGVENSTNVPFSVSTDRGDHDSEDAARKDLKGEVKTTPLPSLDSSQLINDESHTAFKPPGSRRKMGSSRRHKEKQAPDSVAEPSSELKEEIADVEGAIVQERIFSPIDGMMTNEEQNEELVVSVIGESSYSGEEVHEEEIRISDMQQINLIDYSNQSALPDITEDLNIISEPFSEHKEATVVTSEEPIVEQSDQFDPSDTKVSTPELTSPGEYSYSLVDQQAMEQSNSEQVPEELPSVSSVADGEPKEREEEESSIALKMVTAKSNNQEPTKPGGRVGVENSTNVPFIVSTVKGDHDSEDAARKDLKGEVKTTPLPSLDSSQLINDESHTAFKPPGSRRKMGSSRRHKEKRAPDSVAEPSSELKGEAAEVEGTILQESIFSPVDGMMTNEEQNEELVVSVIGESSYSVEEVHEEAIGPSDMQQINLIEYSNQRVLPDITEDLNIISEPFSEHKEATVVTSEEPIVEQSDQFDPSDTKVSTPELTSPGEYSYSLVDQQAIEQSNSEQVPEELPSVSSVADGEPKEREEEESSIALKMVTAKSNNQEPTEPGGRVGVENSTNVPFIVSTDRGDHDSEDAARKDLKGEVKTTPLPSLDSSQLINDESHTAFKPPGSRRKMGSSRRHKEKRAPDSVAEPSSEPKEEAAEVEGTIVQESIFSPVDRMMTNEEQNEELVVSVIGESSYSVEEVHEEAIGPSDMPQINLIDYSNQRALPDITEDLNIISEPFSEHKEATVVTSEEPIVEQSDQFDPSDTKVSTPELTSPGEYSYSLVDQQAMEQSNSEQVPEELLSVSSVANGEPKEREEESSTALKMVTAKSNNQEPTEPRGRVGVENSTNVPFIVSTDRGDHDSEDAARKDLKGEVKTTPLPSLDSSQLINHKSHTAFKPPGSRRKIGSSRRHKGKGAPDSVAESSSELKGEAAVEGTIVKEVHEEEIRPPDMQQMHLIDYSNESALPSITEDLNIISGTTKYQNDVAESHHSEFSGNTIIDGSTGQNGSNPDEKQGWINQDSHMFNPEKAQSSDVKKVDTASNQVEQSEYDFNPTAEQSSPQEKEEEGLPSDTLHPETPSPLEYKLQNNSGIIVDQGNQDLSTKRKSEELHSVEGNEGEQNMKESAAESEIVLVMEAASPQSLDSPPLSIHTGSKASGKRRKLGSRRRHTDKQVPDCVTEPSSGRKEEAVGTSTGNQVSDRETTVTDIKEQTVPDFNPTEKMSKNRSSAKEENTVQMRQEAATLSQSLTSSNIIVTSDDASRSDEGNSLTSSEHINNEEEKTAVKVCEDLNQLSESVEVSVLKDCEEVDILSCVTDSHKEEINVKERTNVKETVEGARNQECDTEAAHFDGEEKCGNNAANEAALIQTDPQASASGHVSEGSVISIAEAPTKPLNSQEMQGTRRKMGSTRRNLLSRKQVRELDDKDETKQSNPDVENEESNSSRTEGVLLTITADVSTEGNDQPAMSTVCEEQQETKENSSEPLRRASDLQAKESNMIPGLDVSTALSPEPSASHGKETVEFCQGDDVRDSGGHEVIQELCSQATRASDIATEGEEVTCVVKRHDHASDEETNATTDTYSDMKGAGAIAGNRRRKMGSTRRNLRPRREEEDVAQRQDVDIEATATPRVGGAPTESVSRSVTKDEETGSDSERRKEEALETIQRSHVGESHTKPLAHPVVEELQDSLSRPAQMAHHLTPDHLPAKAPTSPKQDGLAEAAAGGRRRKMGSHRKSRGHPSSIGQSVGEAAVPQERRERSEEPMSRLEGLSEVDERGKKSPSNTFITESAQRPQPSSEKEPVQQQPPAEIRLDQEIPKKFSLDVGSKAYNVLLVGESSVGKTSFMKRAQSGKFSLDIPASVGLDSCKWTVVVDGKPVVLQLWDTAGQERFHSITRQVFHRAQAFLLMYDITSSHSFSSVSYWANCIQEGASDSVTVLLLGNKSDHEERRVKTEEGETLSKEYNFEFMECSAASGENVIQSLETVARMLQLKVDTREEAMVLDKDPPHKKRSGCC